VVAEASTPCSYLVNIGNRIYRRNRVHLRSAPPVKDPNQIHTGNTEQSTIQSNSTDVMSTEMERQTQNEGPSDAKVFTRSGRLVKTPAKFKDFV